MTQAALKAMSNAQENRGVEVAVGLDEEQLHGVLDLWKAWMEERGVEWAPERVARYLYMAISAGNWLPVIAWDGDTPVGMTETRFEIDPFTGHLTGWGDRAYVLPEYRTEGVFRGLVEGCFFMGVIMGTEVDGLTVSSESMFLKRFYEKHGFREFGIMMRRGAVG